MEKYKAKIAKVLEVMPSQVFLYWKGRVGLFALLKSMGIKEGDEVVIPAFTCVVVPNAIIYLGAKPIYVDINRATYNTDLDKIKEKVTPRTKCILIQNTFGLSSEIEEIVAFSKENNIFSIEDCTHGFGGKYNGRPNGTTADASFFSTQWNKPFSTGVGGFVCLNKEELSQEVVKTNEELVLPFFKEKFILSSLIKFRKYFLKPRTYWFLLKMYRFLSKKGVVVGSSSDEEITSVNMPKNYFKASSKVQSKEGIRGLKRLEESLALRKKNAKLFNEFLKENNKTFVNEELHSNHSFLKFPILIKNRKQFLEKAEKESINLGDWFISMIHPITEGFEKWHLNVEEFPVAKEIGGIILNLDTDTENPDKVIQFLTKNRSDIL